MAKPSSEDIPEPKLAMGFIISNPSKTIASAITDDGIYDLTQNTVLTDEDLELPEDWEENISSHAGIDTDHESQARGGKLQASHKQNERVTDPLTAPYHSTSRSNASAGRTPLRSTHRKSRTGCSHSREELQRSDSTRPSRGGKGRAYQSNYLVWKQKQGGSISDSECSMSNHEGLFSGSPKIPNHRMEFDPSISLGENREVFLT